ncbi:GL24129 [Drosophila persimilis]|uniref:GL24129 n=1 Tax=Drosophila persimilis TaxID=7234 RepID=B4G3Z0_DROPE|nr:GL24129 [Drosophila persimilis]
MELDHQERERERDREHLQSEVRPITTENENCSLHSPVQSSPVQESEADASG